MSKVNGNIQKETVGGALNGLFGSLGSNNLALSETGGVSTGWISGGAITAIGDAAPDISAGVGYVYVTALDTYVRVVWNAVANLTVTNNAVNYISVNSSGVVSATTAVPTAADQRTAIQLGRVSVTGGVITGITSTVVSIKQTAPQLYDLFKALGTVKTGLALTAASTNLKIAIASGAIYSQGVSAQTAVNAPNEADFTGNNPQTYRMFTQTGVSGGDVTDLPVGSYDNGGTVTAIPGAGSQATIFTVYKFSSGNVRIFYGQTIYTNLSTAVAAIGSYNPVVPAAFADAIVLGYIAATKNATNLSQSTQAIFINTNRFGGVGGAVASAGGFMFTDFSNASGVLPIANGGTGSATQNFVDLTNPQTVGGDKTYTGSAIFGTNPSAFGAIRLPNNTGVFWRNAANTNNLGLTLNSSDVLISSANISVGSVTTSTVANSMVKTNGSGTLVAAVSNTDYLPVNSPTMTGTPTAPTATGGTNTTQIATTAFVQSAVSGVSNYWDRTSSILSPVTANDRISIATSSTIAITATSGSSSALSGVSTSGVATITRTSSASNPAIQVVNNGGGPIANFDNNSGNQSVILQNGGYQWAGATASTDAVFDGSKNLVSNAITGTGNGVRQTSPTLVTPNIGAATGTSLTISGNFESSAGNITLPSAQRIAWQNGGVNNGQINYTFGTGMNFVTNGSGKMMLSDAGGLRLTTYTAGTATFDGSGNLTSVSDSTQKERFTPYTDGLSAFRKLKGKATNYYWKESSGMDTSRPYTFFKAQDLQKAIPESVSGPEGKLSVDHRPILAAATNAIVELDEKDTELKKQIDKLMSIIEKQDARILYLEKQLLK